MIHSGDINNDIFKEGQEQLSTFLSNKNIDYETTKSLVDSGYYYNESVPDVILDSFYGSNAMLPVNAISNRGLIETTKPVYEIASLKEAIEVFRDNTKNINPEFIERFAFRGVNTERFIERPYPNPWVCDSKGREPSLISSYWRQYKAEHYKNRPFSEGPSIFKTSLADSLIYKGIDVYELKRRNYEKYGVHSISDLEDFPDCESQEYYRRYASHKIYGNEGYTLEQHYGMPTAVLDVTFDLPTALFFALHKFSMLSNGNACYKHNCNENAAVYCLLYSNPPLKASRDIINEIIMFDHMKPLRPIRQKCATVYQGSLGINEAAYFIIFTLKLKNNFSLDGIPRQDELFPSKEEDAFYRELLLIKESNPKHWGEIVTYE